MITSFYVFEKDYENPRNCDVCSKGMAEGYLNEENPTAYCSTDCLSKAYGKKAAASMIREGLAFYTEWYDEIKTECERCGIKTKLYDWRYCAACLHDLEE